MYLPVSRTRLLRCCALLLLLLWTALMPLHALAGCVIDVSDKLSPVYPGHCLEVLRDDDGELTLAEVTSPTSGHAFRPNTTNAPALGITRSAFWYRGILGNDASQPVTRYLRFANGRIGRFHVYTRTSGQDWQEQQAGMHGQASPDPDLTTVSHVFKLQIPAESTLEVYFRVDTPFAILIPMSLWTPETFMLQERIEFWLFGLYYGIMLAMILYNAFLWWMLRERTYLFYLGFLLAITTNFLLYNAFVSTFLLPEDTWLTARVWMASYSVFGVFIVLFTATFLGLDIRNGRDRMISSLLFVLCAAGFTLSLSGYTHTAMIVTTVAGLAIDTAVIAWTWRSIRLGDSSARFFLLSWLAFFIGIGLFACTGNGLIPYHGWGAYAMQAGSAIGALGLSISLGDRMRQLREDRDRTREAAAKSERLASLGLLSAGIAHDINNPNHFAKLSAQTLKGQLEDLQAFLDDLVDEAGEEAAEIRGEFRKRFMRMNEQVGLIDEGTSRIADIVKSMRANSRTGSGERESVDPVECLESTLTLVMTRFKEKVRIEKQFDERKTIAGTPAQLNQVFMNLLFNACQAIEEKPVTQGAQTPALRLSSRVEGTTLIIGIEDEGCGMSAETMSKLFTPFFTTKDKDRGTGLGMSICQSIIKEHGGRVEVNSTLGVGTRIEVYLPVSE